MSGNERELCAGASLPPAGRYIIDPPHSFVYFDARHSVVGLVRGRFDRISGVLIVNADPAECGVDIVIEAASISTQNSKRDEDLQSTSYFNVSSYPTVRYRGIGITCDDESLWRMSGSLSIREVTKQVDLSFRFNGVAPPEAGRPTRVAFHAVAATKRAEYGMTRDLIQELGALLHDRPDVKIEIDVEALADS